MISIFFGSPGCGKTSFLASFVQRYRNKALKDQLRYRLPKYEHIYSNVDCVGSSHLEVTLLDKFAPPKRSLLLIDEAGIVYNNRNYKSLPQGTIEFFKLHRHYGCDIIFFSQSWDDIDITVRRLADEIYWVTKFWQFSFARLIRKRVGVDEEKHDIVDDFFKVGLLRKSSFKVIFRPRYYRYFDSFVTPDRPLLP